MINFCAECGASLSDKEIESWVFLCGENYADPTCDVCCEKAHRKILDRLSYARYNEPGRYESLNQIVEENDFPGFRD